MMTSRRAKLVIAAVWALSFLICFPPLVGWNGTRTQMSDLAANVTAAGNTTCLELHQCTLFNEKAYVIYSALGSFYIPMLFMFFFYWRIYLVASRTTRALKVGYRTTKSSKSSQGSPEEKMTLRIHRYSCCTVAAAPSTFRPRELSSLVAFDLTALFALFAQY